MSRLARCPCDSAGDTHVAKQGLTPVHAPGRPFKQFLGDARCGMPFNLGGPGYVVNRQALKLLVANLESPQCAPATTTFAEDVMVSNCLKFLGVHASMNLTRDDTGEMFNPFNPNTHYSMGPGGQDWYRLCAYDLE